MCTLTDIFLRWTEILVIALMCGVLIYLVWLIRRSRTTAKAETPKPGTHEANRAREILGTFAREYRIPVLKPHEAEPQEIANFEIEVTWRGRDEQGVGQWSVGHRGVLFDRLGNSVDEAHARESAKESPDCVYPIPADYLFELTNALLVVSDIATPIVRHQWAEWRAIGRPAAGGAFG